MNPANPDTKLARDILSISDEFDKNPDRELHEMLKHQCVYNAPQYRWFKPIDFDSNGSYIFKRNRFDDTDGDIIVSLCVDNPTNNTLNLNLHTHGEDHVVLNNWTLEPNEQGRLIKPVEGDLLNLRAMLYSKLVLSAEYASNEEMPKEMPKIKILYQIAQHTTDKNMLKNELLRTLYHYTDNKKVFRTREGILQFYNKDTDRWV